MTWTDTFLTKEKTETSSPWLNQRLFSLWNVFDCSIRGVLPHTHQLWPYLPRKSNTWCLIFQHMGLHSNCLLVWRFQKSYLGMIGHCWTYIWGLFFPDELLAKKIFAEVKILTKYFIMTQQIYRTACIYYWTVYNSVKISTPINLSDCMHI